MNNGANIIKRSGFATGYTAVFINNKLKNNLKKWFNCADSRKKEVYLQSETNNYVTNTKRNYYD